MNGGSVLSHESGLFPPFGRVPQIVENDGFSRGKQPFKHGAWMPHGFPTFGNGGGKHPETAIRRGDEHKGPVHGLGLVQGVQDVQESVFGGLGCGQLLEPLQHQLGMGSQNSLTQTHDLPIQSDFVEFLSPQTKADFFKSVWLHHVFRDPLQCRRLIAEKHGRDHQVAVVVVASVQKPLFAKS
jgi:hypothetical protein